MEMISIPLDPLSAGVHTLTAQYSGDTTYPAFTFGNYTLSVGRGKSTQTGLTVSSSTMTAGENVTSSASVTGPGHSTPSGTVTFTAGSLNLGSAATDANGNAAVTTTSLTPGAYSVIASFAGQPGSSPSQSTPVSVTIIQVPTTLTFSASPATAGVGLPVTLTTLVQYVAGTTLHPTGTITIKDGSTTLTTLSLKDGSASFITTSLAAGTHSLTATYSGDANFIKSTGNATVTITNP
jgi:large repetitive protein